MPWASTSPYVLDLIYAHVGWEGRTAPVVQAEMAIDLPQITELVSGGPRILTQMGPAAKPRLIKKIILY